MKLPLWPVVGPPFLSTATSANLTRQWTHPHGALLYLCVLIPLFVTCCRMGRLPTVIRICLEARLRPLRY
jgi:hypothetical protein